MAAISALLLSALLSALPNGARLYRVLSDGRDAGAASLLLRRAPGGGLSWRWRSRIAVSRSPCLFSEERRSGTWRPGEPVPDEIAASLVHGEPGRWVATRLSGEAARVLPGADGLPDGVVLDVLGISYVAAPAAALSWNRCRAGVLDEGLKVQGALGIRPRRLREAEWNLGGRIIQVSVPDLPPPPDVVAAVDGEYARAAGRDCKTVAAALARRLSDVGRKAWIVAGLLLDHGRLWPHAWVRVQVGGVYQAVDATTGLSWADAGRIEVGPLEGGNRLGTGAELLRLRKAKVTLVSASPAD